MAEILRPEVFSAATATMVGGTDLLADDNDDTYLDFFTSGSVTCFLPTPETRDSFQFVLEVRSREVEDNLSIGFMSAMLICPANGRTYVNMYVGPGLEYENTRLRSGVVSLGEAEAASLYVNLGFSAFGTTAHHRVSEVSVILLPVGRGSGANFAYRGRFGGTP